MPINVTMPALSPTMTEGTLAKWVVSEGDTVEAGDVIAEIETDKATMEVEAVDEGTMGKIIVSEGTQGVAVNSVIAVLLEDGESADDIDLSSAANDTTPPKPEKQKPAQPEAAPTTPTSSSAAAGSSAPSTSDGDRIKASPLARRIAKDKGLDLSAIKGSGPRGRIIKVDVENAKAGASASTSSAPSQQAAPKPASSGPNAKQLADMLGMEYQEVPNDNMRKTIARRLQESKQEVPHFYLSVECELDKLLQTRTEMNAQADGAFKLSVNDFVIKAVANALHAFPDANVSWTDEAILQYKHADISVAVATPKGLITPIVKAAETKGLKTISAEVKDLAGRAREGKLKPEEFQGGTFSVSNLGMFGIDEFSAIINPPQGCILAVGAGVQKPVVVAGEIQIRTVMKCTLSVDHRCVDGAVGAQFLQVFKKYIENPMNMLL